jgi:hypothetical protein
VAVDDTGVSAPPFASITSAPDGIFTLLPTALILPFETTTVPSSMVAPETSTPARA